MSHAPVMLEEMLQALSPRDGAVYVDVTFGGGGYAQAILEHASCRVIGIDRDPAAVRRGEQMAGGREDLTILEGCFSQLQALLQGQGISTVDGIIADIGVSSFQLDQPERGFSFRDNGPLDMRMSAAGETAADIVNNWEVRDLALLFQRYGEEPEAMRVAKAIEIWRAEQPFETTAQLAAVVAQAKRRVKPGRDPATQVFQALRIEVNNEIGELKALLDAVPSLLKPHGRLIVVSFHSLEDRIVKNAINDQGGRQDRPSRHLPAMAEASPALFAWAHRKPILPSTQEISGNPRARSARLRTAIRQPTKSAVNDDGECDRKVAA